MDIKIGNVLYINDSLRLILTKYEDKDTIEALFLTYVQIDVKTSFDTIAET